MKIANGYLESKQLKLLEASRETAVVVNSIDFKKLPETFLCLYFESEFADGCDIIESYEAWSDLKMAIVRFHPLQEAGNLCTLLCTCYFNAGVKILDLVALNGLGDQLAIQDVCQGN